MKALETGGLTHVTHRARQEVEGSRDDFHQFEQLCADGYLRLSRIRGDPLGCESRPAQGPVSARARVAIPPFEPPCAFIGQVNDLALTEFDALTITSQSRSETINYGRKDSRRRSADSINVKPAR
jgi:hypothetical protein